MLIIFYILLSSENSPIHKFLDEKTECRVIEENDGDLP